LRRESAFTQSARSDVDALAHRGIGLGTDGALRIVAQRSADACPLLRHDSSTNVLIRRYRQFTNS
jgi:glucose-6-phosphate isomerase